MRNFVKKSYSWVPHFDKVLLRLEWNCGFFNKSIFLAQSSFLLPSLYLDVFRRILMYLTVFWCILPFSNCFINSSMDVHNHRCPFQCLTLKCTSKLQHYKTGRIGQNIFKFIWIHKYLSLSSWMCMKKLHFNSILSGCAQMCIDMHIYAHPAISELKFYKTVRKW